MPADPHDTAHDAAYQGAPGAYSEQAARQLLGPDATLLPERTLEEVFQAIAASRARHAVIPVENTLAGTVPNAYELLLSQDAHVIAETRVHIDHVLVAAPATRRDGVRRVLSHPVALAQCGEFFRTHAGIQAVPVFDTAGAVEIVMRENDGETAAIASRRAAELYGATILAEHLQDHTENWTRFLLVARGALAHALPNAQRALVVFGVKHEPGTLARVLLRFAEYGVNLTKIESRPIHGRPFEYQFIVELSAAAGGLALDDVLARVQPSTAWMKLLGTYA